MSLPRILAALIALAVALVLIVAIAQSGSMENLWYEQAALLDQTPWFSAALAQMFAGYVLMAILIVLVEGSLLKGLIWSAPLIVLGNIWAGIWLFLRLPRLIALFKPADKPGA